MKQLKRKDYQSKSLWSLQTILHTPLWTWFRYFLRSLSVQRKVTKHRLTKRIDQLLYLEKTKRNHSKSYNQLPILHHTKDDFHSKETVNQIIMNCGLPNIGNTCFINAVLQCLLHLSTFQDYFIQEYKRLRMYVLKDEPRKETNIRTKLLMMDTFTELIHCMQVPVDIKQSMMNNIKTDINDCKNPRVNRVSIQEEHLKLQQIFRKWLNSLSKTTDLIMGDGIKQQQQDAEEFLSTLLDIFHQVFLLNRQLEGNISKMSIEHDMDWIEKHEKHCHPHFQESYASFFSDLGEKRWRATRLNNSSLISDLFCGQSITGSHCTICHSMSSQHEEFRVLSLSIPLKYPSSRENNESQENVLSLDDCFEQYRAMTCLSNEDAVMCNGFCQQKTNRMTQTLFSKLPKVLIIHLKRFSTIISNDQEFTKPKESQSFFKDFLSSFTDNEMSTSIPIAKMGKLTTPICFPLGSKESLDLTSNLYCRDSKISLQLVAVVAHLGSEIHAGHYVAYVKASSEWSSVQSNATLSTEGESSKWLKYDDDVVTIISEDVFREETLSTAYLLFYGS